jgi:deoxyribonuclease-4
MGTPRKRGSLNDLQSLPSGEELEGLNRIVAALDLIHRDLPGYRTVTCLETTVGAGTHLGYSFHHLAYLRSSVAEPDRIGFCFDTCHVTAAGYDMNTPRNGAAVLDEFDDLCGLHRIRVFHINDSAGIVGSRLDRHAHIGEGCCGTPCFRTIVNHPDTLYVPKILETPKGLNDKGVEWDSVNIQRLKRMTKPANRADKTLAAATAAGPRTGRKTGRRNET